VSAERQAESKYRAPALDKGLDILEYLSSQPNGQTRAEIVKAIGRSQSEIYRMLERLVARDYVSRSAEGDRYALTMKLFFLGARYPPVRRLVARAQPLMDAFAERTQQSVHLAMPEHGAALVVAQASSPANWEFRLRVGAKLDLGSTSSGQTLLAFQSPDRLDETLAEWGGRPLAAELEPIASTLQSLRKQGYRDGPSLQLAGVRDLSVPIMGPGGEAVAVVTCPYLHRVDAATADEATTLRELQDLAAKISIG